MSTTAFPLAWPAGQARTPSEKRKRSDFRATLGKAIQECLAEIRRMGGRLPIVSTNVPLRNDGLPYATARPGNDTGAAVYFEYKGAQRVFACDRWLKLEDNLHAIALSIAAIRGIERWGSSDMLDRAFQGFTALPPPQGKKHWLDVFGFIADVPLLVVEDEYRKLAKQAHPDRGGSAARMAELNQAIAEARAEKGARG